MKKEREGRDENRSSWFFSTQDFLLGEIGLEVTM